MNKEYYVYILECKDHSLYTGITTNIERRLAQHSQGKGAKYTRGRGPFTLRYLEKCPSRNEALKRERALKSIPTNKKWQIISEMENGDVSTEKL